MKICLISPYHGGSHQAWAEGFHKHSSHQVELLSLPARFWKWRMHGGAITLARRYLGRSDSESFEPDDLLLVTDMLDLTTFLAITRRSTSRLPVALYMHENQLTYPLPEDPAEGPMRRQHGERDLHYAFINFASMLVADRVFFNSSHHKESWFEALPAMLQHFPEYNELNTVPLLQRKSAILPVGVDLSRLKPRSVNHQDFDSPLIVWNQRWEFDKNPEEFFNALYTLADEGINFRLALCGESFRRQPNEFNLAAERLSQQIVHYGYADPADYRRFLHQAAVTVSTAYHEFFGISIIEAMACRTFPILPDRLSYPEIVPAQFHRFCLYQDHEGLLATLRWALSRPEELSPITDELSAATQRFDWTELAPVYDYIFRHMELF